MKKIFLLTSLIAIIFGFSLNSNISNNSFAKNNTNNIEEINSTNNNIETSEKDGVIEIDEESFLITSEGGSTFAQVDYKIEASSQIRNLYWFETEESPNSSDPVIGAKVTNGTSDETINADNTCSYEGTITSEDLTSSNDDNFYNNTYLYASDINARSYKSNKYSFYAEDNGENKESPGIITQESEVILNENKKEAKVDYKITPAKDEAGIPIIPASIEWYDNGDDNNFNHNEHQLDSNEDLAINEEGKFISGTLTAKDLARDTEYNDTVLRIGESTKETYNVVKVESFNTNINDESEPGSISVIGEPTVNNSDTTATVEYEITKALDIDGGIVDPVSITWFYLDPNKDNEPQELASKESDFANISGNNSERKVTGDITTDGDSIKKDQFYDINYLAFTYEKDKDIIKYSNYFSFSTWIANKEGKTTIIRSSKTGRYGATVTYQMDEYPTNQFGYSSTIYNITWVDSECNPLGNGGGVEDNPPAEGKQGTINVEGLTAGTEYNNTYLLINDGSENGYLSDPIEEFRTDSGDSEAKITDAEVIKKNGDNATVEYTIDPAKNNQEVLLSPIQIYWYAEDGKTILAQEKPDSDYGGKMTAKDLEINKDYGVTYFIVSYKWIDDEGNEGATKNTNVIDSTTIPFTAGNYKSKYITIGSIALAIIIAIIIIISLFIYGWKKRRRIS